MFCKMSTCFVSNDTNITRLWSSNFILKFLLKAIYEKWTVLKCCCTFYRFLSLWWKAGWPCDTQVVFSHVRFQAAPSLAPCNPSQENGLFWLTLTGFHLCPWLLGLALQTPPPLQNQVPAVLTPWRVFRNGVLTNSSSCWGWESQELQFHVDRPSV